VCVCVCARAGVRVRADGREGRDGKIKISPRVEEKRKKIRYARRCAVLKKIRLVSCARHDFSVQDEKTYLLYYYKRSRCQADNLYCLRRSKYWGPRQIAMFNRDFLQIFVISTYNRIK
jgi:hypothetical protein